MDQLACKVAKYFLLVLICHCFCAAEGQDPIVPPPVTNLTYTVTSYGVPTVSILLEWAHPMTDPDTEYAITVSAVPDISLNRTTNTTQLPVADLLYNTGYSISVEATNINGSSTPATLVLFEFGCGAPQSPENGTVLLPSMSTQLGAQVAVLCLVNGTFVPTSGAICTMRGWLPAPQDVLCGDRELPTEDTEVSLAGIVAGSVVGILLVLVLEAVWLVICIRRDIKKQSDLYKF